jgi:hypothetical protein
MRLKGKAKIIIKDKDGRVAYQEEHSNTITPALQKIFETNLAGTNDFTKLTPILDKLLGGVCLWDGLLDESSVYLPKQTRATLTGHAGQHTYESAAADPTRGNPDTEDEAYGPTENGYTWVWTFDRSQAIGDITGLTLCHADVGDYYNQQELNTMPADFSPIENITNYTIDADDFSYDPTSPAASTLPQVVGIKLPATQGDEHQHGADKIPLGFYDDINRVVSIELIETTEEDDWRGYGKTRSGQVKIYISKFTGDELWLRNSLGDLIPEEEKTITTTLPRWQWGNFNSLGRCCYFVAYDEEIKHVYFLTIGRCTSWGLDPQPLIPYNDQWIPKDWELHITDINLETGEKTIKSIDLTDHFPPNMTNLCFRSHAEQYDPLQVLIVDGKAILPIYDLDWKEEQRWDPVTQQWYSVSVPDWDGVPSQANKGIRLNLRTAEVVDFILGYTANEGNNGRTYTACLDLGNERAMYPDAYIERTAQPSGSGFLTYNFKSRSMTRDTSIFGTDWRENRTFTAGKDGELILYATNPKGNGVQGSRIRGSILNKMYQATVFRLQQKVAKRNDQTMTVIYNIEQEEDEE